jgi:hypothetical protein
MSMGWGSERGGRDGWTGLGPHEELGADTMVDIAGLLLVHNASTIQYVVCSCCSFWGHFLRSSKDSF